MVIRDNWMKKSVLLSLSLDIKHLLLMYCKVTQLIMPPHLCNGGGIHCFPRCRIIFSFGQNLFESTFRNRVRLSVCTTTFKRIAGLRFYPKY